VPQAFDPLTVRIPAVVATLDNGLRVVAHRDPKSPIVAVHVAYRAGSGDEPPGKYGLAHLFEHLMFSGSEHSAENYFLPLERIGATSINAIATDDYTAYFAAVPGEALDYALWMEAERMSCLGGALDRGALDRQREVVRNELRQRQAAPYGRVAGLIRRHSYPREHPYAHHPYGLIEDLDNISLDDALRWFETSYGAANATLVIAGDIEPRDAIEKTRRRFETIPAGTPRPQRSPWIARPEHETRLQLYERDAPARIYRVWNVPGLGSPERASLAIACELLAGGESSWLFRQLVRDARLASAVSIELQERELESQIVLWATAAADARLAELDSALTVELSRFASETSSKQEFESARARIVARFIRETERVCGLRSKSDVLATATIATGDPNAATAHLQSIAALDPGTAAANVARWLDDRNLVIEVCPQAPSRPSSRGVVHGRPPAPPAQSVWHWPQVSRARLKNGLRVMHIEREGTGPIELRLILEPGAAAERPAIGGLVGLALNLISRARTGPRGASVGEELARIGSILGGRAELDGGVLDSSMMPDNLASGLSLLARAVTNPVFEARDLEQAKSRCAGIIRDEVARPLALRLRTLPHRVYPNGHPYARPFSGSGTEAGLASATGERVQEFYSRWLRPNRATLVTVGPVRMRDLLALLGQTFGAWQPSSNSVAEPMTPAMKFSRSRPCLIDRVGLAQVGIFAALPLPSRRDPDIDALMVANVVLGGMFSSRLNLALRETHGWSYGTRSELLHARFGGLWLVHSFVRSDRAADVISEIRQHLDRLARQRSVTNAEFTRARNHVVASLPAGYETNAQCAQALEHLVLHALPDDYYAAMAGRLVGLRARDLSRSVRRVGAAPVSWLIVGDAARTSEQLSSSGLGAPEIIAAR
jgi:zinc protease